MAKHLQKNIQGMFVVVETDLIKCHIGKLLVAKKFGYDLLTEQQPL